MGGSKVERGGSNKDRVTIVAAGLTLHEALKAVDVLAHEDIPVRVIDLYTVKPIDADTLADAARATGGRLPVVEDHPAGGGVGGAGLPALAGKGFRGPPHPPPPLPQKPRSGKPAQQRADPRTN